MEKYFRLRNDFAVSGSDFPGKTLTSLTAQKVKDAAKA